MTTENNTLDLPEENPQEGVFKFEPIKGYPMLNWKGKRPFTSTCYYPAQLKEQHGEAVNGWLNKIFWGDNLQVMSHLLREFRGKVDLIYIDPPFDSKIQYKKKISLKSKTAETDTNTFEEKQYSDIWVNDEYLQFIYDRTILLKELLSKDGVLIFHCDWHKSHYIRLILDEIFGGNNFVNEIVWHYYNKMQGNIGRFASNHDVLYVYSKSSNYTFNKIKELRDEPVQQIKRIWDGEKKALVNAKDENGNVIYITSTHKTLDDVWRMSMLQPADKIEVTNYPTQKPEALIERLIYAYSNPGELVLDSFLGSGTTQNVAIKMGRKFIGCDINLTAIHTSVSRAIKLISNNVTSSFPKIKNGLTEQDYNNINISNIYKGFEVYNVNHYDVFRNPVQAKELLIQALDIQPIPNSIYDGEKDSRMVKLMPVNHIATKADVADLIHGVDYKAFEKRKDEKPNQPVEKMTLICMGHEPDLAAFVQHEIGYKIDVEVVDILRDRSDLQFKRDSEALFKVEEGKLIVDKFYPMNLLQKLSQTKDTVSDWREMVESIMIDWNYDGAVFQPALTDIPAKNELVQGSYDIPKDAGTIRIKITDLLSESLERDLTAEELAHG
jgi:adenine-specific DNA-methyltransferase